MKSSWVSKFVGQNLVAPRITRNIRGFLETASSGGLESAFYRESCISVAGTTVAILSSPKII